MRHARQCGKELQHASLRTSPDQPFDQVRHAPSLILRASGLP